ncbi:MAG: hypothetical protein VW963_11440, partial [Candidatus Neomarinimicrobiota bacterium]
ATLVNCTVTGNDGPWVWKWAGQSTIINTIIHGNFDSNVESGIIQGSIESTESTVSYSNIEGGYPGEGNIDESPLFLGPSSGDYSLSNYSPLLGLGTLSGAPVIDINGDTRPLPSGSNPDMGAFENNLSVPLDPPAPTNLVATAGNSSVSLTWEKNGFNGESIIQRSEESGGEFETIGSASGNVLTNNVSPFIPLNGTSYYYRKGLSNGYVKIYSE